MFPLGSVLVPGMAFPLHVFELRYRRLVEDCQAGDGRFGVVLIERGSEVGGGDVRTDVGTLARIVQADPMSDGRWMLVAVGERRIRVERWLPDDPYPRAEVSDWPDSRLVAGSETTGGETDPVVSGDWDEVNALLRRASALSREIGEPAPSLDVKLADDPVLASYQASAVAPLGEADRQHLLVAPSVPERLALLEQMLADQIELLQARLAGG